MENQAYIVALMLMVASPLAIATDEGQAILENFDKTPDDVVYEADLTKRDEIRDNLDDSVLSDRVADGNGPPCLTLEEWKRLSEDRVDLSKEDWDRKESDEVREESNDGARGDDDSKEKQENGDNNDKKNYYEKDWETDKVTKQTDKDCLTELEFNEYVSKMGNDRKDIDCLTVGDVRQKWTHFHDYIDKEKERENDREEDRERDEDERDEDDESEDEDSDEEEEARGDDDGDEDEHSHDDDIADDHSHDDDEADNHDHEDDRYDENWEEIRAAIEELKVACEEGNEEACLELRELITELEKDREQVWDREQKDSDDSKCVGKHMMNHMKKMFSRDRDEEKHDGEWDRDDRYREDWNDDEEWEEIRVMMAELGVACEEGDEEACEELEEWVQEIANDERERKEECERHDDDDENDRDEEDEENWDDEEDEDSEDDDPENA